MQIIMGLADSLMLDQEAKKEIDSISILCLDQLKGITENHSESVTKIRNQAEKCLRKDYLVRFLLYIFLRMCRAG